MTRATVGLVLIAFVASACIATPGPSERPAAAATPSATPSPSASSLPSAPASPQPSPSVAPSPTPEPVPTLQPFPDATPATGLPIDLDHVAWVGLQGEARPDGTYVRHVFAGILNHPPSIRADVEPGAGYPWVVVAEDIVVFRSESGGAAHLEIRSASDGATIGAIHLDGTGSGTLAIDPAHRLAYVAMIRATGGVDIHRVSFDGAKDDVLVTLDKRFTPDGIPTERYDLVVDPDGVGIVEACATADGCRLWEIPPAAKTAPAPRTLPGKPPIVCSIVGATRDWLVVQDDAACTADTSEASLPVRAIQRSDGRSHLVTDDHVGAGPLVELNGRTVLVGADPIFIGSTIDIVTYDLATGARSVVLRGVPPGPDDTTMLVSGTALPSPWVLLQPWVLESSGLPTVPARLFNLETRELVELPMGTFGWT